MSTDLILGAIIAVIVLGVVFLVVVIAIEESQQYSLFESRCRECHTYIERVDNDWGYKAEYFDRGCRRCGYWGRPVVVRKQAQAEERG